MNRPDVKHLLESIDLDEVELPDGLADRLWSDLQPIVEAPRPIARADDAENLLSNEPVLLVEPREVPSVAWDLRRRLLVGAAAIVAVIGGLQVLSTQPTDEIQSVDSRFASATESCTVLNSELTRLLDGTKFNAWTDNPVENLEGPELTALASVFGTFLDTTDPTGLTEQFRRMQIIRRGLLVAASQAENGEHSAASQTVSRVIDTINNQHEWHSEGPLEGCFDS